jgi:hypothetical protein
VKDVASGEPAKHDRLAENHRDFVGDHECSTANTARRTELGRLQMTFGDSCRGSEIAGPGGGRFTRRRDRGRMRF